MDKFLPIMLERRTHGQHTVIFASKEDHATPSSVELPPPEDLPGLILPDGSINWECECLGGMGTGPCAVQFREAFSCFHFSKEPEKGSECLDAFNQMNECFKKYPDIYGPGNEEEEARKYGLI